MSIGAARWLWFASFFLLLPFPMLVFDAFVPAVRYAILAGAALVVMLAEGGAGPVPGIVLIFSLHALVYTAVAWLLAWGVTGLVARVAPRAAASLGLLALAAGLVAGLLCEPYRTPFCRAATGGLLEILS